jgi:hypothetical protein
MSAFHEHAQALQAAYQAALETDSRQAFPRHKWSLNRTALCPHLDALHSLKSAPSSAHI